MSALVDQWEPEDEDYCECPGPPPPPQFLLPPPPAQCGGGGLEESHLHFCHPEPFGAELTQTAFPSLPIIVVCSSVVLVALLVASFLLWKHKKKVQNFLPCKTEHQGHCDLAGGPNGVTYDDVLINHHPTRLPNHHGLTPIEVSMLLDVKYGPPSHLSGHLEQGGKDHFNPIYEEVSEEKPGTRSYDSDIEDSEAEARTVASEDEFAEDELSLAEFPPPPTGSGSSSMRGSTGGDLCVSDGEEGLFHYRGGGGGPPRGHSLERNKDGHPSDGFLAKQNYYMSKSMLAPSLNCEAAQRLLLRHPTENIYAIVEEEAARKVPKGGPPPSQQEEESYGDMRPVYDGRALCT